MSLTVILMTRGRATLFPQTLIRLLDNATRADTKILLALDGDDRASQGVMRDLELTDKRLIVSVRPREDSRGEKYDRALVEAPADVYLPTVDHAHILTKGYDQIILDAAALFPDGIGCVYSPMANASFPGLQAPTAKLVEKLGCIYSHEYPFWFIDHELDDISRMIGRYVFAAIDVDHTRHPNKTLRMRDVAFWTTYFDTATLERRNKAHSIIDGDDFIAPPWMKEVMKTWHQAIEMRSLHINAIVRADARNIEAKRTVEDAIDEGYQRIKARADKKIMQLFAELERAAA